MDSNASNHFSELQGTICNTLSALDGSQEFARDTWKRPDVAGGYGGGGTTRVLSGGKVFEQAAVNFSEVEGSLPEEMAFSLVGKKEPVPFYATGISLIIHPISPLIPTTHANYRYLEVADKKWYGGGADLTPYYLDHEDARHFHQSLKTVCDRHDPTYYETFKKECDSYFYLPHRGEARGIGGIFFDYLGKETPEKLPEIFSFSKEVSNSFLGSYTPIVERKRNEPFTEEQKNFQLHRRGRYVEFNLLYDRGTQFGLKTGGRTESILCSLPPVVHWSYRNDPKPGTPEAELLEVLKSPRDWV